MQDDLGISIVKSVCSSETRDLAVDWAEVGIDLLLDEGVLKEAPFLGTVVKLASISKTIRDRLFVRKVCAFLKASPEFDDVERLGFAREHLDDPVKARKLSDAIVFSLDRLDDLEKAEMLAKVFAALVRKHISYMEFRRLAGGIERAIVDDLRVLLSNPASPMLENEEFLRLLEPAGFVSTGGGSSRAGAIGTRTDVNSLGKLFRKCMMEE